VEEPWHGLLETMRSAAASADYPEFYRLDHELHQMPIVAAGIDSLLRSWEMATADRKEWVAKAQRDYWPSLMALYAANMCSFLTPGRVATIWWRLMPATILLKPGGTGLRHCSATRTF
jgi:hypothetical protein